MILTALIFLATALLGGWAFVILGQRGMNNLPVILSFGGSFIIGMCFLHLVPEAYDVTHLEPASSCWSDSCFKDSSNFCRRASNMGITTPMNMEVTVTSHSHWVDFRGPR